MAEAKKTSLFESLGRTAMKLSAITAGLLWLGSMVFPHLAIPALAVNNTLGLFLLGTLFYGTGALTKK